MDTQRSEVSDPIFRSLFHHMNQLSVVQHDREGLSLEKTTHFLRVLRGHTNKADVYLDRFTEFDVVALRKATGKRLAHVLLDIDACVAPAYGRILPENIIHTQRLLSQGVEIGVYSNCKGTNRLKPLLDLGIQSYEGIHPKPARQGFLDACDTFRFDPASTWMIGDNPNTDGGAIGVLEGMAFVRPIPEDYRILSWKQRAVLPFQKLLRAIAINRTLRTGFLPIPKAGMIDQWAKDSPNGDRITDNSPDYPYSKPGDE